jgi:hypothetical protein
MASVFKQLFQKLSRPPSEAEKALTGWHVPFEKLKDGTLFVAGDLDLSYGIGFPELPTFQT